MPTELTSPEGESGTSAALEAVNIGVVGKRALPSQPRAGRAALPFMSDPSRNHSFPSPRAGINRGSYLIKVGMGEAFKTLHHLGVGEAEAGRECENLSASGGRGEKKKKSSP